MCGKINVPTLPFRLSVHSTRIMYYMDLICGYEYLYFIARTDRGRISFGKDIHMHKQRDGWWYLRLYHWWPLYIMQTNLWHPSWRYRWCSRTNPRFLVYCRVGNGTLGRDGKFKTPSVYYVFLKTHFHVRSMNGGWKESISSYLTVGWSAYNQRACSSFSNIVNRLNTACAMLYSLFLLIEIMKWCGFDFSAKVISNTGQCSRTRTCMKVYLLSTYTPQRGAYIPLSTSTNPTRNEFLW